jgi:FlaG/FlaF family flagellin (archaellin)
MNRTAVSIFAVVLAVAIVVAFATTIHGVDMTQVAKNEMPPGVSGLSQPHPPIDRSSGRAVQN